MSRPKSVGEEREALTGHLLDYVQAGEKTAKDVTRFFCNRLDVTELKEVVEELCGLPPDMAEEEEEEEVQDETD